MPAAGVAAGVVAVEAAEVVEPHVPAVGSAGAAVLGGNVRAGHDGVLAGCVTGLIVWSVTTHGWISRQTMRTAYPSRFHAW